VPRTLFEGKTDIANCQSRISPTQVAFSWFDSLNKTQWRLNLWIFLLPVFSTFFSHFLFLGPPKQQISSCAPQRPINSDPQLYRGDSLKSREFHFPAKRGEIFYNFVFLYLCFCLGNEYSEQNCKHTFSKWTFNRFFYCVSFWFGTGFLKYFKFTTFEYNYYLYFHKYRVMLPDTMIFTRSECFLLLFL
jgi:hypothetical protein